MTCPFCDEPGTRPELHAHLSDAHAAEVKTWETGAGRRFYQLDCPRCDEGFRKEIKPRLKDPGYLEEYAREIRVVAFDMFLYHWQAAHEEESVG